jgi:MFS family permease
MSVSSLVPCLRMDGNLYEFFLQVSIIILVVVVFACSWSDKKKLRKPLMLSAMIGELLGYIPGLLTSIYFDEIPLQFAHTLSLVIPAMFGGGNLMTIGVFAYLASVTTEENMTARFGAFTIFITALGIVGPAFGGPLLKALGYVCKCTEVLNSMENEFSIFHRHSHSRHCIFELGSSDSYLPSGRCQRDLGETNGRATSR